MSVNYGRYIVSFDKEEQMWNADPKARKLKVKGDIVEYSYPPTTTYVEKSRSDLQHAMKKDGAGHIRTRRGEWVVGYNPNNLATTE